MIKKAVILLSLIVANVSVIGQVVKTEQQKTSTKIELFSSKSGVIIKFIDTNIPSLIPSIYQVETRIRKINNGSIDAYFFQIEKTGKYDNSTASIEYSDLLEVLKAIDILKAENIKDIELNPDYLENKFITDDGFRVGYYVSNGITKWYIKLEKYGSDNTIFFNNHIVIVGLFTDAKNKIDELKIKR